MIIAEKLEPSTSSHHGKMSKNIKMYHSKKTTNENCIWNLLGSEMFLTAENEKQVIERTGNT